jgi:streptomycin 6-kinase
MAASAITLPDTFILTIRNAFGAAGGKFLSDLPALIDEAAQRWDLSNIRPVENLSYNFVAFAARAGQEVILKLGVPNPELTAEMDALRLYDGRGACQLFESDAPKGMLLVERLRPGRMLAALKDDEQATLVAAQVMRQIWRPAQGAGRFLRLRQWFDAMPRMRSRFGGGTGPLPARLVGRAEGLARELFAEGESEVLLHADFHHYNVLQSERGWLVIDPKGVVGPPGYEVGPFLLNPFDLLQRTDPFRVTQRRVAILSDGLGFEPWRIRAWGIAHAMLSACWSLEGKEDIRSTLECARLLERLPG